MCGSLRVFRMRITATTLQGLTAPPTRCKPQRRRHAGHLRGRTTRLATGVGSKREQARQHSPTLDQATAVTSTGGPGTAAEATTYTFPSGAERRGILRDSTEATATTLLLGPCHQRASRRSQCHPLKSSRGSIQHGRCCESRENAETAPMPSWRLPLVPASASSFTDTGLIASSTYYRSC